MLKKGINPFQYKFESEEEQQSHLQQIEQYKQENTPKEIENKMNQSWRGVYIEWAEATIKEDESRFDFDVLDRKNLYSYLPGLRPALTTQLPLESFFAARLFTSHLLKLPAKLTFLAAGA